MYSLCCFRNEFKNRWGDKLSPQYFLYQLYSWCMNHFNLYIIYKYSFIFYAVIISPIAFVRSSLIKHGIIFRSTKIVVWLWLSRGICCGIAVSVSKKILVWLPYYAYLLSLHLRKLGHSWFIVDNKMDIIVDNIMGI